MTLLILTENNLAVAKAALRHGYKDVRSGHLTEALAFALGFRTHAALLAQLAAEAARLPGVADCDAERFTKRLADFDYAAIDPAPFDDALTSSALPERPFVRFKRGDMAANNRHHDDCLRKHRPMMMIMMGRRYAELQWDCITTSSGEYEHLQGETGHTLGHTLFARFQRLAKGAPGKPYFTGSAFTGWIERLLPETAERLAEMYFKLLYLPFRAPPAAGRQRA